MTTETLDLSARLAALLEKRPAVPAPAPGIYENVPSEVYHSWDALSNSQLGHLRPPKSPAHLRAYLLAPPAETPSLVLGRALHCAILEPDRFASAYAVAEQCSAIKKGDKQRCSNQGKVLHRDLGWLCGTHNSGHNGDLDHSLMSISAADHAVCLGVRSSIREHPSAWAMLESDGRVELSIVWIDDETGVLCKARFDKHAPGISTGLLIDPKSTTDASKRGFSNAVQTYGYHIQGAHYLSGAQAVGLKAHHFANIAFEKEPPYAVAVYRLDESAISIGEMLRRPLIRLYAQCRKRDEWPAYPEDVQPIFVPDYALQRTEDEVRELGENYGVRVEDIIGAKAARARIMAGANYEVVG